MRGGHRQRTLIRKMDTEGGVRRGPMLWKHVYSSIAEHNTLFTNYFFEHFSQHLWTANSRRTLFICSNRDIQQQQQQTGYENNSKLCLSQINAE